MVAYSGLERPHGAEKAAIGLVVGGMRARDRQLIAAEERIEDVRARHAPLGQDPRRQPPEDAHVMHQPSIGLAVAVLLGHEAVDQAEFGQPLQHVLDRPVHHVQRVDQCPVPVEQHHGGTR